MKCKKIFLVLLIAMTIIILNCNYVNAAESFNMNATSDKQNYSVGQTVEVTVNLSNIVSESGLYGISGTLQYDTNVFEEIQSDNAGNSDSLVGLNSWSVSYNKQDKMVAAITSVAAKGEQSIFKILLKVKNGATLGKTTIMLNDVIGASADNGDDITTTPTSVSVNIQDGSSTQEIPPEIIPSPIPSPEPSPASPDILPSHIPQASSSPKVITTTPTSGQKPSGSLPQTGINDCIMPVLLGALIISLISYIAYRRYKDI